MTADAYKPPESKLTQKTGVHVPQSVLTNIRNAWICGLISTVLTVLVVSIHLVGSEDNRFGAFALIDASAMGLLTLGVSRKSRVCAVLMLLLFLSNRLLLWADNGFTSGFGIAFVFLWFYTMGVIGTFRYHAIMQNDAN
ncbi:MAG: hypothetical protein AAF610_12335 [Pseudomonadota bacterium]